MARIQLPSFGELIASLPPHLREPFERIPTAVQPSLGPVHDPSEIRAPRPAYPARTSYYDPCRDPDGVHRPSASPASSRYLQVPTPQPSPARAAASPYPSPSGRHTPQSAAQIGRSPRRKADTPRKGAKCVRVDPAFWRRYFEMPAPGVVELRPLVPPIPNPEAGGPPISFTLHPMTDEEFVVGGRTVAHTGPRGRWDIPGSERRPMLVVACPLALEAVHNLRDRIQWTLEPLDPSWSRPGSAAPSPTLSPRRARQALRPM
ncbi:hypothetical protein BV25DRAFT_797624 [Artomyces pyxidatus]|uniref:Uncharacterized protein n=1 Tax=Artomyces pyxidatus TaxID=48021 RepID=A0ACB8SXC1_9AGAM|nr:hypothetical protein BV25DRAFT_797624 [Artomyces pyxidatus]